MWIPAELWPTFEARYDLVPKLKLQIEELEGERRELRLSIKELRLAADSANERAVIAEARSERLMNQNFELRLQIAASGTPVWHYLVTFGAGAGALLALALAEDRL